MTRARRMDPVVRAVGHDEREHAARLAECGQRVADAEQRLAELEKYQADYASGLHSRTAAGISATEMRDFRAFLARLSEAVRTQQRLLAQARAEHEAAREAWRRAAQRARSIDHVVERWQAEERIHRERREQIDIDERALQLTRARTRH
ncbi:MAG TPA: flagellar export protein FliJ [Steroidobacteraceae bacterium]|nr:flagellar export protein FliJ [Steroidobacteraceae bacterium]